MKDKTLPAKTTTWRGYTLDELRYERVISLTRIEIEKAKFLDAAETTRNELPIIGRKSAGLLLRSIGKLEYAILLFKLYHKVAPLFKKKK